MSYEQQTERLTPELEEAQLCLMAIVGLSDSPIKPKDIFIHLQHDVRGSIDDATYSMRRDRNGVLNYLLVENGQAVIDEEGFSLTESGAVYLEDSLEYREKNQIVDKVDGVIESLKQYLQNQPN